MTGRVAWCHYSCHACCGDVDCISLGFTCESKKPTGCMLTMCSTRGEPSCTSTSPPVCTQTQTQTLRAIQSTLWCLVMTVSACRIQELIGTFVEDSVPSAAHKQLLRRAGNDLARELALEPDFLNTMLYPKTDAVRGVLHRAVMKNRQHGVSCPTAVCAPPS